MFENKTGPLDSARAEGITRIEAGELSSAALRSGASAETLFAAAADAELIPAFDIISEFKLDTES